MRFRQGDTWRAQVVERIGQHDAILSFAGSLVRVTDQSFGPLHEGQWLELLVQSESPLRFKRYRARGPRP